MESPMEHLWRTLHAESNKTTLEEDKDGNYAECKA